QVGDNSIYVIDPATMKVIDRYQVPGNPQHVIPSWDLKTLWVASSAPSRNISGAVTPIDPLTGKAGKPIVVRDAYNLRFTPDGSVFFVADMLADGVHVIDSKEFKEVGFISTGVGTHALYPSRDGKKLYVVNRGSHSMMGQSHGQGSISVLDFSTLTVEVTWPIPGGGSPDLGHVSADRETLWLAARRGHA